MLKAEVVLNDIEGLFDAKFIEVVEAVNANLKETAELVCNEAKSTAGFIDRTGNLRKSIKLRKSKFEDGGYIVIATGKNKEKGYHAHLVEYGHVQISPSGKQIGKRVPPHPFMRPALEKGIVKAVALFRETR